MKYPTMEQVESARIMQLCEWTRFLPSPGQNAIGKDEAWFNDETFDSIMQREVAVMDRILERQKELGGWTPQISKSLGWGR